MARVRMLAARKELEEYNRRIETGHHEPAVQKQLSDKLIAATDEYIVVLTQYLQEKRQSE